MRWTFLLVLGCAGPTSYQSRVADITDDSTPPPTRRDTTSEPSAEVTDEGRSVNVRLVRDLGDATAIHGTCALRQNGDVRCWGQGPELPEIGGASSVVVGGYYGNTVCAILRGRVHCWYPTADGRTEYRARGVRDATRVTAGRERTCALIEGGEVWCWGTERPASIGVSDAVDVACAHADCCVAHEDGGVSCWADEWSVEGCSDCGHGALPRERVEGLESIIALSADARRFCARQRSGESTCWIGAAGGHSGLEPRGALVAMEGGDTADSLRPIGQVDVQGHVRLHVADTGSWTMANGLSDVVELSDDECARRADGRVVCWGEDSRYAAGVLVELPPEVDPAPEPEVEAAAEAEGEIVLEEPPPESR